MRSTEALMDEHRVIEEVLGVLERMAESAEAGRAVDREKADTALVVVREFADKCHHGKEEHRLFKLMQERGMSAQEGPLAVMLHEHEVGRSHVRGMMEALPAAAAGDAEAGRAFAQSARRYAALLRQHIIKEDKVLYPMAEQMLSADDDAQLVREFEDFEREEMGADVHETYHRLVRELADGQG